MMSSTCIIACNNIITILTNKADPQQIYIYIYIQFLKDNRSRHAAVDRDSHHFYDKVSQESGPNYISMSWFQKSLSWRYVRSMHAKWNKDSFGYIGVIICMYGLIDIYIYIMTRLARLDVSRTRVDINIKRQCGPTIFFNISRIL